MSIIQRLGGLLCTSGVVLAPFHVKNCSNSGLLVHFTVCFLQYPYRTKHGVRYKYSRVLWISFESLLENVWPDQQKKDMKLLMFFVDLVMLSQTMSNKMINNFLIIWIENNSFLQIFLYVWTMSNSSLYLFLYTLTTLNRNLWLNSVNLNTF